MTDHPAANRRVLIVEDDPLVCELIEQILDGGDYAITTVHDGRDVMEVLWSLDPSLVILDCNLPGRPGMLLLEDIRRSAPNPTVPVLMLTGRAGAWNENAAMRHGASRYMRKPFVPSDLQVAVAQLMHAHA